MISGEIRPLLLRYQAGLEKMANLSAEARLDGDSAAPAAAGRTRTAVNHRVRARTAHDRVPPGCPLRSDRTTRDTTSQGGGKIFLSHQSICDGGSNPNRRSQTVREATNERENDGLVPNFGSSSP